MIIYVVLLTILAFTIALYWIAKGWSSSFTPRVWLQHATAFMVVLAVYAVLLLDQVPFYWYAEYLYSQDGGVIVDATAHDQQGYLTQSNCEVSTYPGPDRFSTSCYHQLFESPHQTRALQFIEFELNKDQAKSPSPFYQRQGPGIYRITLEEKPLSDCPVLQDLQAKLAKVDPRYVHNGFHSDLDMLQQAKDGKKCPVVRKVDAAMSKYRKGQQLQSTVIFSDGVHEIVRADRRDWVTLDGSSSLYRSINYGVNGAIILWGAQSDVWPPSPSVGDENAMLGNPDPFGLRIQSKKGVKQ